MQEGRVELAGGLSLPYVEQGDPAGVPVLLVHAYVDSWHSFEPVLAHLPDWIHAFAVTQRGHGDASRPDSGYGLPDLAGDLAAFMNAVGLRQALVAGSSSGGYVAQRLAADRPERVLGLVLIGAPRSLREKPAIFDRVSALTDPVDRGFVREFVMSTVSGPVPEDFLELMVSESCKLPARVWKSALEGLIESDPPTDTATIRVPTLVLWGADDAYLPRSEQEALTAAIPGAKLVVYDNVGHVVLWEQPERVAADIAEMARSVSPITR